ncbi:uncharacterized protein LOC110440311 [Mizuhopecten yessoensis]|uniref:DUF7042 domain-containing protein n=1 Tax=Mizuhopecten yessoensis TaxID=6573 RepID=A0A210PL94_MIZYE|nr:uncharacterized protein LOC110440311 [Mizuhopecten yessoensis]OWF37262.1 hypothetical protein KP79_PYT12713 [Mizuhopecten yessoensis]
MAVPRELSRLGRSVGIILLLTTVCLPFTGATCTYPSVFDGVWYSSDFGEVTFSSSAFTTKYGVSTFGIQSFTCTESTDNHYLGVSNSFTYLGVSLQIALCLDMFSQDSEKVVYYTALPVLANTTNDRLVLKVSGYAFSISNDCDFSSTRNVRQLGVFVKNGSLSVAKINCPNSLLGRFNYTFDTGSGNLCTSSTELDVCDDVTEMTYNYSACSVVQGYSQEGKLTCVYYEESGDEVFTLAINTDTTDPDESTYYRFTCYAASLSANDSRVYMTQYPRGCHYLQTSTSVDSAGATLELVSSETCVPVTSSTEDESIQSAGTIVAVVLVSFIILACIASAIAVGCYKKWKVKYVTPGVEPIKSPPMNTFDRVNSAFSRDGMFATNSPYPTVSEIAICRFGPSPIQDDDGGITLCATTPGLLEAERITIAPATPGLNDEYMDINEVDQNVKQFEPYPEVNVTNQELEPELKSLHEAEKDPDQVSLPVYSEVGGETPEPTRIAEVDGEGTDVAL